MTAAEHECSSACRSCSAGADAALRPRRLAALPEKPPAIDWAHYKAAVAKAGMVDEFQKKVGPPVSWRGGGLFGGLDGESQCLKHSSSSPGARRRLRTLWSTQRPQVPAGLVSSVQAGAGKHE